jgi:hypothetical protein
MSALRQRAARFHKRAPPTDRRCCITKHGDDELGTDRGALKFATTTSSAGRCTQQFSGGGVDRRCLACHGKTYRSKCIYISAGWTMAMAVARSDDGGTDEICEMT